MVTRGEIIEEQAPTMAYDATNGTTTTRRWRGIPAAAWGQMQELMNSSAAERPSYCELFDNGDGTMTVVARWGRDATIPSQTNGGPAQVNNEWMILGRAETRNIIEHPRYAGIGTNGINLVQMAANDISAKRNYRDFAAERETHLTFLDATPLIHADFKTRAKELLDGLISNTNQHYEHEMYTFRRTTTLTDGYERQIRAANVQKVYLADKGVGARSTKLEAENQAESGIMPTSIIAVMGLIERPEVASEYSLGWRKRSFDVRSNALGKFEITQEYEFGLWRTLYYPNAV